MNSVAVFCLVAASVLLGANSCKEGWSGFKDHCYKLFTNEKGLNWDEALGKCKSFEANLASVHSEEENKFIGELITKAGDKKHCYWNGMRLERNPYGGKDVKGSSWTDGSAVDYADPTKVKNKMPWLRGEPNGEPDEYCVMYWGLASAGAGVEAWNDLACARRATADNEKLGAVCKAPRKDGGTEAPTTSTTSGYGTTTTGYGTASTTTGYGTASTTIGYGTASTTTGYGTASTTTGSTTAGYGSTSTPTTAGYGTTSTTAGYGTTSTTAGYGSTSTPTTAGYGTTSTASSTTTGYGTESTTRGGYGGASSTTTSTPSSTTTKDAKYGYGKFGSR